MPMVSQDLGALGAAGYPTTRKETPIHEDQAPCSHPCSLPKGGTGGKPLNLDNSSLTWNQGIPGRQGWGGEAEAAHGAHQYQVTARTEVKLWANPATNYPRDAKLEPSLSLWERDPGPARPIPLLKAMERDQGWFSVPTSSLSVHDSPG